MSSIQKSLNLRRTIASSAFTMFMLVAMVGIFSLFSIWSINRAWIDGTRQTVQLDSLSRAALDAQVSFKVQVQEWKNVLLRGEDPVLLEKYLKSFKANAVETQKNVSRVSHEASSLGFIEEAAEADLLAETHRTLTLQYETALTEAQAGDLSLSPISARQIDLSLRGIDRDLETRIGVLADEIVALADQERRSLEARMQDRYQTLRWFIISVISLSLVITAYVLTGAMRATRT
jgi:methyl-accepting chemotaxis protein